ncbi:tRNA processing endoribonuclease [Colletotrichum musicola]|uniref:tRNA processing endoribonuclease n=1 Tax=Colletotrichum musicola TaxID=2175873 RepID=A0A8H6NYJ7_9PEZI|nr:tRNA processing endoribonuclease [Colletotrichum musicola]
MDQPRRSASPPRRMRACVPCTRAKARCHFRDENAERHLCDRCERLGVECAAKTTRVVRRSRQLKPLVNRVASLEQQLASLVTGERSSGSLVTSGPPSLPTTSSEGSTSESHSPPHRQRASKDRELDTRRDEHVEDIHPGPEKPPFGLTWAQAVVVLNDFRELYAPNFPFVLIKPSTTPQELLSEKPFLFRAIMLVAVPLPRSRATKIQHEVMAYLGQRMLLEEEASLEILQGILVIVMWADIKYFYDKQITRLVYLALGYAHSLGITRIPLSVLEANGRAAQPDDCFAAKLASSMAQHHTLEEQRAFLGLFCAVTVNSNQFARRNPLLQQNGGGGGGVGLYLDICCENLSRSGRGGDATAARMVRFFQASGRIAEIFGSFANRATGETYSTLFEAQATAVRREVDKIGEQVDPGDPLQSHLWMQYNSVLVQLYEPATKAATSSPLHRTSCLLDCLSAARAYFDALTALPPERFLYRTSAFISHAQTAVTATTRLLALEVEGWDLESARAALDFLDVVERLTGLFRGAAAAGRERMRRFATETGAETGEGGESADGMCEELVEKMGWIGDWYRSRLESEQDRVGADAANRDLMDEISRLWHWSPDAAGMPFFGGLLNPLDVSYEGI